MRTYGVSGSLGSAKSKPGTMVVSGYEAGGRCHRRECPVCSHNKILAFYAHPPYSIINCCTKTDTLSVLSLFMENASA